MSLLFNGRSIHGKERLPAPFIFVTVLLTLYSVAPVAAASALHTRTYEVCGVGGNEEAKLCHHHPASTNATRSGTSMLYQHLGRSGLVVSRLSYGAWISFGLQLNTDQAYKIMKFCIGVGINFFDNAEAYANGKAETIMGEALQRIWKETNTERDDLVISTKLFFGTKRPLYKVNRIGLGRKHIIGGMKASLKRLQLDHVDVVFAHRYDPHTPMEEIVRAFNFLIDKGYAHYWCTSEWSAANIEEAMLVAKGLGLIPPICEQPQYNLLHRDRFEVEYKPLYEKYGLGTTTWSTLASGVLTGKYNDGIPEGSRLGLKSLSSFKHLFTSGQRHGDWSSVIVKVRNLQSIADQMKCTLPQLALAWALKNNKVSTVIMGGTKIAQLEENVASIQCMSRLDDGLMGKIEAALENAPKGERDWKTHRRL
jgi:voltage-dependent potassium channel beta subunit